MKVELHINGRLNIELTPETDIERTVLAVMLSSAEKGKSVKLEQEEGAGELETVIVSVEK